MKALIVSIFLLLCFNTNAEEIDFKVIALFKNAAMIEHQGKKKMLRSGQTYLQKIKLISADSHQANFLVDGKKVSLGLHQSKMGNVFSSGKVTDKKVVRIVRDNAGMYRSRGFINKIPVNFLVDTGASQVAMNEVTAFKIGLQYRMQGKKVGVSTASGVSNAWVVTLDRVNIGGLELKHVEALVIKGAGPNEVLLGMSFLKQLKMQHDGNMLRLTKKF